MNPGHARRTPVHKPLFILALAFGTALSVAISPKSANAGTDDYPTDWKNAQMDSLLDTWGESNRECTSFVAFRMSDRNGFEMPFAASASDWADRATNLGYSVDDTPAVGAVAWTPTHVAWVEGVSGDNVTVEEYNELDSNNNGIFGDDGTYDERSAPVGSFQYIHLADIGSGGGGSGTGGVTPGVVRANGAGWQWLLKNSNIGGTADLAFSFGVHSTDTPVAGDWDGDGDATVGVYRRDGAGWHWYLRNANSAGPANVAFVYGLSTDIPIVGDWDGNGTVTPGVVRANGAGWQWLLRNSNSGGAATMTFAFGVRSTDTPVVGDWDGDAGLRQSRR